MAGPGGGGLRCSGCEFLRGPISQGPGRKRGEQRNVFVAERKKLRYSHRVVPREGGITRRTDMVRKKRYGPKGGRRPIINV